MQRRITVLKNTLAGFSGLVIATGTEAQGSTVNEFAVCHRFKYQANCPFGINLYVNRQKQEIGRR